MRANTSAPSSFASTTRVLISVAVVALLVLALVFGLLQSAVRAQSEDEALPPPNLLSRTGSQSFSQDSMGSVYNTESVTYFGKVLTAGDFDGDGIDDLVIGVPDEYQRATGNDPEVSGVLYVVPGTRARLLAASARVAEGEGRFASALAVGALYRNALDGIIAGAPEATVFVDASIAMAGAGLVRYYRDVQDLLFFSLFPEAIEGHPHAAAEPFDRYGTALAVGDFNSDGFDDLAIGVPGEDIGGATEAGAVIIEYASNSNAAYPSQFFTQADPALPGGAESGDRFGETLAAGDFNCDGFDDLAIGAPYEDLGSATDAGWLIVLYADPEGKGLTGVGSGAYGQDSPGVGMVPESGDRFAASLAAGDFNKDGCDDLAIGSPYEDEIAVDTGIVHVLYGGNLGLNTEEPAQYLAQGRDGIPDSREAGDTFGFALATGDLNGDGIDDLVIGVPYEDVGDVDTGMIHIVPGSANGLHRDLARTLTQQTFATSSSNERNDHFGYSLVAGDFNGDGFDDLAVGAPGETISGFQQAGEVNVMYAAPETVFLPNVDR